MAKLTTPAKTAEMLSVRERVLLFCAASRTDWLQAGVTHRWLNQGIIAGEQLTPGAPWRIRLTEDLRARVAEEAPDDFLTMYQTMRLLGVSRQTIGRRACASAPSTP
jgi:hypothetical protein